jgi:ATP-dependent Lon protease
VLDPEQNQAFVDHFLDLDYDLSDVLFLCTANSLHTIPLPLQDRMEIIELSGYTDEEKQKIGRQYLIPKQLEANGMTNVELVFTDQAVKELIHHYTKESGVRSLERAVSSVVRKLAREYVKDGKKKKSFKVDVRMVQRLLGAQKYRYNSADAADQIGMTNGLAVTIFGGDLLPAEVTVLPGKGKLTLTGKLGDVMQESAQAAMSYIRSRSDSLGLVRDFQTKVDVHVHFPEGAIPKDGPSAGITRATALASALLRIPARSAIAMTGEITLRGRVLPIGGLKEKILAAHRAEIFEVIIPEENEKDLKDIPKKVLKAMTIHPVKNMDQVLRIALAHETEDFLVEPSEQVDWRLYATDKKEEPAGDSTAVLPVERPAAH